MAKDPHFPFYAQDFLVDVIQLDEHLTGAYIRLLSVLWINKFCLSDAESLLKISPSVPRVVEVLKDKFTFHANGTITNNRMEIERVKRIEIREKRSLSGKIGVEKRLSKRLSKRVSKNEAKDNDNDNDKDKEIKEKYGEFKNVLLTKIQIEKIILKFGLEKANAAIEKLSSFMASKGKKYRNHYAALLSWAIDAVENGNGKKSKTPLEKAREIIENKAKEHERNGT